MQPLNEATKMKVDFTTNTVRVSVLNMILGNDWYLLVQRVSPIMAETLYLGTNDIEADKIYNRAKKQLKEVKQ
jgi:hypothetical protein